MSASTPTTIYNDIDNDVLVDIFRRTMVIAKSDERFRAKIMAGDFRVGYYTVRGQEVLAAASMTALRQDDYLVTTYRGMHDELAKGTPIKALWAEFLGRATGTCKGKGGPMHITDLVNGVMVTTGIVGSGLPIGTGLALASQMKGEDRVTIVCFGDGATNIGAFHEALNMASVWKLPVIFLCQNNQWAEYTSYAGGTSAKRIVDRAPGYSMAGVNVDGNDAIAMYNAVKEAADRARAGEGPTLIEAVCYRMMGHTIFSPTTHMPKEFLAEAVAADPIPRLRKLLADRGIDAAMLAQIEADVEKETDEAVEFALGSPYADLSEIHTDVLAAEIAA